ncbi:MAG: type II toxin-antitoxin system VapB family antitoxin [Gemmatimonadetes bacterium]|nr:type II toxin-antitoxin system VapB family antitoxin [Gemmatimonadota bacterium]
MQTAKLFNNGRSQAVRLPKEFRFSGNDVYIKKYQGIVMLLPKESPWTSLVDSLDRFSSDFMNERNQPNQQERASL